MKTLISISIALLFSQVVRAQENAVKEDFLFENPVTREKVKIETGNKVVIHFKIPDVRITGTIVHISDSSMILSVSQKQMFVSFRNIVSMKVIAQAKKKDMS